MNQPLHLLTKSPLSGPVIVAVPESAKRDNTSTSLVHPLPLSPLLFLRGRQSWPELAVGIVVTVPLHPPTMRLLQAARSRL